MFRSAYFYLSLKNLTLIQSFSAAALVYYAAEYVGKPYFGASLTYNSKHTLRGLFSPFNLFHYALSHDDSYPFLLSQALRTNDCIVTRQSPFVSLTTGCSMLMFVIVFRQPKKQTNK